jgi:hypothetical protein
MNKISISETISTTYRFAFVGIGKVIGLIWLPAFLMAGTSYFCMRPYIDFMATDPEPADILQHGGAILGMLAGLLLCLYFFAVMAVAITREALHPTPTVTYFRFPFGGAVFRVIGGYFALMGLTLLFCVLLVLVAAVFGIAAKSVPAGGGIAILIVTTVLMIAGFLGLIYAAVRLGYLLVPAATEENHIGIEQSWKLTKGNFWRIVLIVLATLGPMIVVQGIIQCVVVGPEYFNPHLEAVGNQAAMAGYKLEQMRLMAQAFPYLTAVGFLLAPFSYGLSFAAAAFSYRALKNPPSVGVA